MNFAIVYCRTTSGIKAPLIKIETNISGGIPFLAIVGMLKTRVDGA